MTFAGAGADNPQRRLAAAIIMARQRDISTSANSELSAEQTSRLPSSLSQFEETVGHRRCRRRSGCKALVDRFQDKTAGEEPREYAAVARQMFRGDHTLGGQEAGLDICHHRGC